MLEANKQMRLAFKALTGTHCQQKRGLPPHITTWIRQLILGMDCKISNFHHHVVKRMFSIYFYIYILGKELVCSCMPAWQFSHFPLFLTDVGGKDVFLVCLLFTGLNFCSHLIVLRAPCQKGLSSLRPAEAGKRSFQWEAEIWGSGQDFLLVFPMKSNVL